LVKSSAYLVVTVVTRDPAPTEMRSPDPVQRDAVAGDLVVADCVPAVGRVAAADGVAAARGALCPLSDASAACTGAARLRVTARAAVAPNATAVAIRKLRLAPARITGPLAMISAYVSPSKPARHGFA
jgi:hypothetical protein